MERGPADALERLKRRAEERALTAGAQDRFVFQASELTLVELMDQNPDLFYQRSDTWWRNESFATTNGTVRQLVLRTTAVPNSFGKTWHGQQKLLGKDELVPSARDVVEGMVAYYQTGTRILPDLYVRTSDVSSFGYRVGVGHFGADGLNISGHWDDARSSVLGLAVCQKS